MMLRWGMLVCVMLGVRAWAADGPKKTELTKVPVLGKAEVGVRSDAPKVEHGVNLDLGEVGRALAGKEGWKYEDGCAAKYRFKGAIFYSYKPEVTKSAEGLKATMKIELAHGLRKDDVAVLDVHFDASGHVIGVRATMKFGKESTDTQLITCPVVIKSSEEDLHPALVQRNLISKQLFNRLTSWIYKVDEEGARQHYVAVVQHNLHVLSESILVSK